MNMNARIVVDANDLSTMERAKLVEDTVRDLGKGRTVAALRHSLTVTRQMMDSLAPKDALCTNAVLTTVRDILDCLAYADTLFSNRHERDWLFERTRYRSHRFSDVQSRMAQLALFQLQDGGFLVDEDDARNAWKVLDTAIHNSSEKPEHSPIETARQALTLAEKAVDAFAVK
jgi:hypothetical protein